MKTTGRQNAEFGFPAVPAGEYLLQYLEGITFQEPRERPDGSRSESVAKVLAIPTKPISRIVKAADGTERFEDIDEDIGRVFLNINLGLPGHETLTRISEQRIADILANVQGSTPGTTLEAEFQAHLNADSWFDDAVINQIKMKLPEKVTRATVTNREYNGKTIADIAKVSLVDGKSVPQPKATNPVTEPVTETESSW